ncbi:MAG TPA: hypothetical protein VMF87_31240 [Streptosporangiaceae bacterium]|nr:hypothetical protein [Streptosporangiaceae bacterium]
MAATSRKRRGISGISVLIVVVVILGLYVAFRSVAPLLQGSDCTAAGDGEDVALNPGQASIAATIAGVAQRQEMPSRAVTVAYAAALQETKLQNLPYGDRDSVGVFQQRPSQGWGPRSDLENPVYATSKFFGALAKIPGYQRMPIYQAAQAVQHSADGFAYQQYQALATHMTPAFTGQNPHGVWCWYSPKIRGTARVEAASHGLAQAFGPQATRAVPDPGLIVRVGSTRKGWAMAAWLVSHAQQYQIADVRYAGYQWTAANGKQGWARTVSPAPPGSVEAG